MSTVRVPVVKNQGLERPQGIWLDTDVYPWQDIRSYVMLLGYVVNMWAKLCHPAPAEEPLHVWENVEGSRVFDIVLSGQTNQISRAFIQILNRPDSIDVDFGAPDLVYVGKCAFGRSSLSAKNLDWGEVERLSYTATMSKIEFNTTASIFPNAYMQGSYDNGFIAMPYTNGGAGLSTGTVGFNTQELAAGGFLRGQGIYGVSAAFSSSFTFFQQKKPKQPVILGQISTPEYGFYPVKWINFETALFVPDEPNCDAFYIALKPGVTANVILYGAQINPYAESAGGGEAGEGGRFEPMNGGFTQ